MKTKQITHFANIYKKTRNKTRSNEGPRASACDKMRKELKKKQKEKSRTSKSTTIDSKNGAVSVNVKQLHVVSENAQMSTEENQKPKDRCRRRCLLQQCKMTAGRRRRRRRRRRVETNDVIDCGFDRGVGGVVVALVDLDVVAVVAQTTTQQRAEQQPAQRNR